MAMITQIDLDTVTVVLRMKNTDANNDAVEQLLDSNMDLSINTQTDNYIEFNYDYSLCRYDNMADARDDAKALIAYIKANLPCNRKVIELDFIAEQFARKCEDTIDQLGSENYRVAEKLKDELFELSLIAWKAANKPKYVVGSLVTVGRKTGVVAAVLDPVRNSPIQDYRYHVQLEFENGTGSYLETCAACRLKRVSVEYLRNATEAIEELLLAY